MCLDRRDRAALACARPADPPAPALAVLAAARLPLLPTVIVGVAAAGVLRHLLGYGTTNRDHESTMDAPQLITEDHWIDTAHGRVFARSWQDGDAAAAGLPPIVLMHDSLGCVRLWGTFPATLARHSGRRVIAYDRPGFGESDARADRLGPDFVRAESTEVFPRLRAQLGIGRFVVMGHSVGGGMATYCAAAAGDDCEALVTEAAQAFVEEKTLAGIRDAKVQFAQPEQFQRLARYHGGKTQWVLDAWIGTWLGPAFADWSLADTLPSVRCPLLAIHGSEDEYGSDVHPDMFTRLAGGPAQMELMPDTRHVPHREREQQVAQRIAAFLDAVPGMRAAAR